MKIDFNNNGVSDFNLDLKTLILIVGGIISLTLTYSSLLSEIQLAKELPIYENAQTMGKLEAQIKSQNSRIYTLEKKVFKIKN
tara:strand:- start:13391 stop:13639 length:249 start_codon:yes stop_codon:yes gene_type:complete